MPTTNELTAKFTDLKATVRSDGDGHFAIGPIAELEFIQWLIGDPLFGYNLKITVGEHTYLGLSEFGLGYAPSHIEVRCDVSRPGGAGRTPVACPRNDRGEGSHADSTVSDAAKPRVAQPHR